MMDLRLRCLCYDVRAGEARKNTPDWVRELPWLLGEGDTDIKDTEVVGEGNTMAGAKTLDNLLAPHRGARSGLYRGLGRNSRKSVKARFKADGGGTSQIPIIAAGGEYVISPEEVESIGGGDITGRNLLQVGTTHSTNQSKFHLLY